MTNPLLEQFQNWIKQLENSPDAAFSSQLAQWQQWISKFHSEAESISPQHADLVKKLSGYSAELVELLADLTRSQARGAPIEDLIDRLRADLHQFNVSHVLEQATQPHQFLDLLFTLKQSQLVLSAEQVAQLKQSLAQLTHPRFAQLRVLIEALLDWSQASSTLSEELDQISNSAIDRFRNLATEGLENDVLLDLWVDCYDKSYRDGFNSDELQAAQAALVNSLARLQLGWQALIDQFAEQLGLPSRSQVDKLIEEFDQQHRRIRKLEVELQALKAAQD